MTVCNFFIRTTTLALEGETGFLLAAMSLNSCSEATLEHLCAVHGAVSPACLTPSSLRLPAGNCTSSLSLTRTKSRRWGRRRSRFRTRRVKLPLAGFATKPSLPMAVATSVLIAKRNSVRGAEDECLCGQIR